MPFANSRKMSELRKQRINEYVLPLSFDNISCREFECGPMMAVNREPLKTAFFSRKTDVMQP
jgi:hypothetical protein